MSETTMSSHYPVEGMFQDDDIKDGDEMVITDTCPNCGEEVNVETDDCIEIDDLDD